MYDTFSSAATRSPRSSDRRPSDVVGPEGRKEGRKEGEEGKKEGRKLMRKLTEGENVEGRKLKKVGRS